MAEDFLNDIYTNANVIVSMKETLRLARKGQWGLLLNKWNECGDSLVSFCKTIASIDDDTGWGIWNRLTVITETISKDDRSQTADLIEEIIPYMYQAITLYGKIDVSEGKYRLFSTLSGFLSIQDLESGRLLCSRIDPMLEAIDRSKSLYNHKMSTFCTYGCSMGYLEYAIYRLSEGRINIVIYDTDKELIDYAKRYGVLDWIPQNHINIIIEPNPDSIVSTLSQYLEDFKTGTVSLNIEKEFIEKMTPEGKAICDNLTLLIQSHIDMEELMEENFNRNRYADCKMISSLKNKAHKDKWIVVAGGPSVDYNLEYIKNNKDAEIIAATTIYGRLQREGIRPDYIAVIDPQARTYGHMQNIQSEDVPLIMTDTASSLFGYKYGGEVYVAPTAGNLFSEDIYNEGKVDAWEQFGTVACFCVKIAVYLGAKEIELVGVDFAYPGEYSHAQGTMDCEKIDRSKSIMVKSVNGGLVCTDQIMLTYIQVMSDLVKKNRNVSFYNLSKEGAYIEGCQSKKDRIDN